MRVPEFYLSVLWRIVHRIQRNVINMAQISTAELHVVELNGFLNAIRCMLAMSHKLLGAAFVDKNGGSLDEIVRDVVADNIGNSAIQKDLEQDFNYVHQLFKKYIYSKMDKINSDVIKQLDWNLVEYYGLVSTAEDENGPWNRLVGQRHRVLEYIDEAGNDAAVFFVEHKTFVVMTYLAEAK